MDPQLNIDATHVMSISTGPGASGMSWAPSHINYTRLGIEYARAAVRYELQLGLLDELIATTARPYRLAEFLNNTNH